MTTTLPKTTPDKQAARTRRHYAKKLQASLTAAADTYGCEATAEAVLARLAEVGMQINDFRRAQAALSAKTALLCLLREQRWADEPGNLVVRYDEMLPGDQLVDFSYNIASSDRLRAIVVSEVAEVRPDGWVRFVGQELFFAPRKITSLVPVHRPTAVT